LPQSDLLETVYYLIAQVCKSTSDESKRKQLNTACMALVRSSTASTRRNALITINGFYKLLGEEFLPYLPETIPYLAEVMEGECQIPSISRLFFVSLRVNTGFKFVR
jgi:U3 small nucleolar RNA-associated protein 10